nr:ABC transporter A family member 9-like [Tanacetum cinerariifolium]
MHSFRSKVETRRSTQTTRKNGVIYSKINNNNNNNNNMNGKTYRSVRCYCLGVPLFSASKPCSAYSRVFVWDIYGDHDVSCAGIIGIKHRHNDVRDTLVDSCFRSGISAGKDVDIGLDGRSDKKLHLADMLLYSWDRGQYVCVDLARSSPLTKSGMIDFAPGWVVIDAAHHKHGKYMAKCAAIGYVFLLFFFLFFRGIRGRRGFIAEADPKVLCGSRHWGTCYYAYF